MDYIFFQVKNLCIFLLFTLKVIDIDAKECTLVTHRRYKRIKYGNMYCLRECN